MGVWGCGERPQAEGLVLSKVGGNLADLRKQKTV